MARRFEDSELVIASHNSGKVREIGELLEPFAISVTSSRRTSPSEPEVPCTNTLVESQIITSTPSSPSARKVASSMSSPIRGSGPIFQSPVWISRP